MVIIEINTVNFGSTGNIMLGIAKAAEKKGVEAYICVPKNKQNTIKPVKNPVFIGNRLLRGVHYVLGEWTGFQGCFSILSTFRFLCRVSALKPDVIHLHNLHDNYINLPMLFRYIKKHNIRTVWTLHDCWSFTGQCPYFTMVRCEKWKTGCFDCPQIHSYPASRVDRTKTMWKLKKKWFTLVPDMTIVTPSKWLADLVAQSYLKDYPIKVINNGIDLSVFKPWKGDFRKKHNIENRFMILGVALYWGERKGLDIFIELAQQLDPDRYQIVLVGTDDKVDAQLPDNIISIHRTRDQKEMAEIYSTADIFVNPTREENYPTVNMEAIACGTPVVTFNTGGSPEIINEQTGIVVQSNTAEELLQVIEKLRSEPVFNKDTCVEQAAAFDREIRFKEYVELFERQD